MNLLSLNLLRCDWRAGEWRVRSIGDRPLFIGNKNQWEIDCFFNA